MSVKKSLYNIVKYQHVTEKSMMLQQLKTADSNVSLKRCKSPKYVFIVDKNANKHEIARSLEQIYSKEGIKVVKVNTINIKGKAKRVRGRPGYKSDQKKAVVTLREGDNIDNV